MAVGFPIGTIAENDLISATLKSKQPYSLPINENINLVYEHKNSETKILKSISTDFVSIDNDKVCTISENDIIFSDNIFALHNIISQNMHVDLIYLDPPYNTGYEFHSKDSSLAYNDKFKLAEYIEFMRIRLILLREVLSEQGSIYVHIGHQMLPYIKVIMDEVFGINNFRNLITRRKCSSKNYTRNQYPNLNDYLLFYSKSNHFIWNKQGLSPSNEWIKKEYPKEDAKGKFKLVPIHAPGERNGETGMEWKGMLPPKGKHWQYTPSKLDELDAKGEIYWSKNGNPRKKVYLTKDKQVPITDYWECYRDAHHQSIKITGYPTEKNIDMLKMLIRSSSNIDSLVLDPFCGSGTTLQAAFDEGRKFIGIDQSLIAIKHSLERFNSINNLKYRFIIDKEVYIQFKDNILKSL